MIRKALENLDRPIRLENWLRRPRLFRMPLNPCMRPGGLYDLPVTLHDGSLALSEPFTIRDVEKRPPPAVAPRECRQRT